MTKHPFPLPVALKSLVTYLDGLNGRASLEDLRKHLRESKVTLEDVRDYVRFDAYHYSRNHVAAGPWYDLLVICWKSGQRSPIHDHANTSCAFKVLTGVCSETVYEFAANGQVYPTHTSKEPTGAIVATQDADTHQVSNLQPMGQDLVTMHIYSPPLKSMHTFSILGDAMRLWRTGQGAEPDSYKGDAI